MNVPAAPKPLLPARAAAPALPPWHLREQWVSWGGVAVATLYFASLESVQGLPFGQTALLIFGLTTVYWQGNRAIYLLVRRWLPSYEQTAHRLALHLLLSLAFMALIALLKGAAGVYLERPAEPYWLSFWSALLHGIIPSLVITGLYESIYFFTEWRRSYTRSADLEKENAISRLEALKQQVDPHFLFNSLNTMAALVGDNEPAQDFLGALANVYRYVLLNKSHSTVPLAQEMAFVDNYLYLLRIRFEHLEVIQDIPAEALLLHVPPSAVQMLLENAIKHNAIGPQHTLRITLRVTAGYLRVVNTTHHKTILEKGTRQGLQNIVNRFELLTERPVTIENRDREFEVALPLLPAA